MNIIKKVKVRNMTSLNWNSNREVPNQFVIETPDGEYFQSYASIIVFVPRGKNKIHLDSADWNYSVTTSKYRNNFLGETTKETQAKIDRGEYVLTNLN